MVRTASPRLPGAASPRLDAKWRSTRSWICVKNTSLGNSGVSRPSRVIAASRQAITALIVTARSIRCPVRCPRYSTLQPDLSIRQGFSMFANKGWLTKEDGGGLDKPVLGVR